MNSKIGKIHNYSAIFMYGSAYSLQFQAHFHIYENCKIDDYTSEQKCIEFPIDIKNSAGWEFTIIFSFSVEKNPQGFKWNVYVAYLEVPTGTKASVT